MYKNTCNKKVVFGTSLCMYRWTVLLTWLIDG